MFEQPNRYLDRAGWALILAIGCWLRLAVLSAMTKKIDFASRREVYFALSVLVRRVEVDLWEAQSSASEISSGPTHFIGTNPNASGLDTSLAVNKVEVGVVNYFKKI